MKTTQQKIYDVNNYRHKNTNKLLTGNVEEVRIVDVKETKYGTSYIYVVDMLINTHIENVMMRVSLQYWSKIKPSEMNKLPFSEGETTDFFITVKNKGNARFETYCIDLPFQHFYQTN